MPWTIQREDTVGGQTTVSSFDLSGLNAPTEVDFFPTELQNPNNPGQPIIISDLVRTHTNHPAMPRDAVQYPISSELMCINKDPEALVQKIVLTHVYVDTRYGKVDLSLPRESWLTLHRQPTENECNNRRDCFNNKALLALCSPTNIIYSIDPNTQQRVSHARCPLSIYSQEQLEPLMTFLKEQDLPETITKVIRKRSKSELPSETDFYARLAQLTSESLYMEFDSLLTLATLITTHELSIKHHRMDMYTYFVNDEPLYKLAARCRDLGNIDLMQTALFKILENAANHSMTGIYYYEADASEQLVHTILWLKRLPRQTLSRDAIESLLKISEFNPYARDIFYDNLSDFWPASFEIAKIPFGYKPEGLDSWDSPHHTNRTLRASLCIMNELALTCSNRQEKIETLEAKNTALEDQLRVLQHREPLLFTEPRNTSNLPTKPAAPRRSVSFS